MSKNLKKGEERGLNLYPVWLSKEEGIIKPQLFAKKLEVEEGIICFQKSGYSDLLRYFRRSQGKDKKAPELLGTYKGKLFKNTVIYRTVFGAPASTTLSEVLIASGIKKILLVGVAGSISSKCKTGDIFVPTWGLREEGVSYHYFPPEVLVRPSNNLLKATREALRGINYLEGGVWTTDVFFRETKDKIKRYAKEGVLAVEMECTALMSVAMYHNIDFAAILAITDETFGDKWKTGFESKEVKEAEAFLARLATKIL